MTPDAVQPSPEPSRAPFARPFLQRDPAQLGTSTVGMGSNEPMVRAYTITGGRTHTDAPQLRFESMVALTDRGVAVIAQLTFERKKIAVLADQPQSVAEISAKICVPIGVARVLVGDLVVDGVLRLYDAPTDASQDISLVRELIDGIRNL
jgi:hypothetical protein